MKKNQVNAILINQTQRRNTVFAFVLTIIITLTLASSFFFIYAERNKKYYVSYDEKSDIRYEVLLKENSFFDDNYLDSNQRYIASLIDYITADFNYKLSLDEKNVEYKYLYRIEANIDVKEDGTTTSLYNKTAELISPKEITTNENEININEKINIDYNYYNDIVKKFIKLYDLERTESTLNINMYVNVIGSCEEFEENNKKEAIISLSIPLNTKTMDINLSDNLVNGTNNVMQCKSMYENNYVFLIIGIIFTLITLGLIIVTIKYEIKTRTAENIYERELKKILNNYSSYIQTLNNEFDFDNYQILNLDNFTDLLEIRDTIRQPILMKENNEKTGAYFIITNNTVLYIYRLKVSDIKKEIHKKI